MKIGSDTPMQKQYKKLKDQYHDAILFFRLGDFFETFNEDAETISKVLGITLTSRGKGKEKYPMAGVPHHSLSMHLPKLSKAGLKVAIADQVEEAVPGKLVERNVTKIITPGTVTDDRSLDIAKNNYVGVVYKYKGEYFLSYIDITVGKVFLFKAENSSILKNELMKLKIAEIVCTEEDRDELAKLYPDTYWAVKSFEEFNLRSSLKIILEQLNVNTLKGFGIENDNLLIIPTSVLISYLLETQKTKLHHIKSLNKYSYDEVMQLDIATIRNLELEDSMTGNQGATLYSVLNRCSTGMGKRLLRKWVLLPLVNRERIEERLDSVDLFFESPVVASEVSGILSKMGDLERLCGKIGYGSANPKDVRAFITALESIISVLNCLSSLKEIPIRVKHLVSLIDTEKIERVIKYLSSAIREDAPAKVNEGNIFNLGYNSEVDELRELMDNNKEVLLKLQQDEIKKTGINSLKVSFNKVFGYYIEVTKVHSSKVPDYYVRKQTLANAERYITDELKVIEEKLLGAEEKLVDLEHKLFFELLENLQLELKSFLLFASAIAEIDVFCSFGIISRKRQYVKPKIIDSGIEIKNGKHPVVDVLNEEVFVPNDLNFSDDSKIHIVTGPNMSGKSTFIRQVALLVLMAHVGCFVPAESMSFNLVDRIFTRVGASDNLAEGLSTFMMEMVETSNILNNATDSSLIILDEIGRGTSTFDGLAIAWAIVEHIIQSVKGYTLFATHYHELTAISDAYSDIDNYTIHVEEAGGEIHFTHHIKKGSADKSYGIHVAKLAGMPKSVVERADKILSSFEKNEKLDGNSKEKVREKSGSKISKDNNKVKINPKKVSKEQLSLL